MLQTATKRILVVDDEADLVDMVRRKLERNGFMVEVAYNGREAIEKVSNQEFDLILTDVVMPVMDGFTFYKNLKDNPDTSKIPVIILTARSNMEGSFRALGADDFLTKPFDGRDLLQKIEGFLRRDEKPTKHAKVFLTGSKPAVLREMEQILSDLGCKTRVVDDPFVLIKNCYEEQPDIVLLDVLLDGLRTPEIIRAMRCFSRLSNLKIVTFTHFDPEQLSDVETIEQLKEAKNECMIVGASKYIGRYTMVSFIDSLREYLF
ncbi:MAG: response regulator [Candidatus Omnitrophica bacterium]|nr:response regulator [Candidatus Omnitrophota bacterium]